MNESDNTPVMSSGGPSGIASWFQIWMKVVTKPNEETFAEITESPQAKTQTALIWAATSGVFGGIQRQLAP